MKKLIVLAVLVLTLSACSSPDTSEFVQCKSSIDGSVVNSSIRDVWFYIQRGNSYQSYNSAFSPRPGDECAIQTIQNHPDMQLGH